MKIIFYFVALCFLLLGVRSTSFASTHESKNSYASSFQYFSQKGQIKTINEDHNILLIEDTDLDLEEEYHGDNSVKESPKTNFFIGKYILLNTLYSSNCQKFTSNFCVNRFNIVPHLSGNTCPIYITQRVLRI
jgi:hypothetical protein